MLQEPASSSYDLQFDLLGYRVRVAWGFWIVALVLGWGWSQYLHQTALAIGMDSPSAPVLLLIWVAAIFLSILVHELGHSLAFRYYGTESRIVLYHFGGLAVPDSFGSWNAARRRNIGPQEQIVISAAGPFLQLALAGLVLAAAYLLKVRIDLPWIEFGTREYPGSASVYALFNFLAMPSIFWAVLNLAPVLPLDGGHILHNALRMSNVGQPTRVAHIVSVGTCLLLGIYFFQTGNMFAGIMFFVFAANNWQAVQYGSGGF